MVRRKSTKGVINSYMLIAVEGDNSPKIFIDAEGGKSTGNEPNSISVDRLKAAEKQIIEFTKVNIFLFNNEINRLIVNYAQPITRKTKTTFVKINQSLLIYLIGFLYVSIVKVRSVWLRTFDGFRRKRKFVYRIVREIWRRYNSVKGTGCLSLSKYLAGISVCEFTKGLSPSLSWKDNIEIDKLANLIESLKFAIKRRLSNIVPIKNYPTFQYKKYFRLLRIIYFSDSARGPPVHT
jgi:hypothetical protein